MDGQEQRGFDVYVGGGLGAVPYQAKLFDSFVPGEEILPLAQAIARVFARLGEKKNRARARIKFLVQDLGIDEIQGTGPRRAQDSAARSALDRISARCRQAAGAAAAPLGEWPAPSADPAFTRWAKTNTRAQKQAGYLVVTIALPLGDITADQLRALADIARRFTRETIRTTVEQNIVLRWVSAERSARALQALRRRAAWPIPAPEPSSISSTCPGTDTCKLGISSSRGLAGELRNRLVEQERSARRSPCRTCTSRSAAASIAAASTTSPTSASTA